MLETTGEKMTGREMIRECWYPANCASVDERFGGVHAFVIKLKYGVNDISHYLGQLLVCPFCGTVMTYEKDGVIKVEGK